MDMAGFLLISIVGQLWRWLAGAVMAKHGHKGKL
jgi:hypothetical protein